MLSKGDGTGRRSFDASDALLKGAGSYGRGDDFCRGGSFCFARKVKPVPPRFLRDISPVFESFSVRNTIRLYRVSKQRTLYCRVCMGRSRALACVCLRTACSAQASDEWTFGSLSSQGNS